MFYCLLLRFSVSNDLKYDAERDLRDIGAKNIQVHSLNKVKHFYDVHNNVKCLLTRMTLHFSVFQFKYGKISSKHNGSVKKGVIFATYSSLIGESQSGGKYKTRFEQLLHWCGEDFDGVVSFQKCFFFSFFLHAYKRLIRPFLFSCNHEYD